MKLKHERFVRNVLDISGPRDAERLESLVLRSFDNRMSAEALRGRERRYAGRAVRLARRIAAGRTIVLRADGLRWSPPEPRWDGR